MLKRSPAFTKTAGQNEDKELIILKNGKAISSHFPCSLIIKDEQLIGLLNVLDKDKNGPKPHASAPDVQSVEPVMFHILASGGENIAIILRNTALKKESHEITVYAYKGERVKHFTDEVFKTNCVLSDTSTEVNTEMSSLVDDLDSKTFKIIVPKLSRIQNLFRIEFRKNDQICREVKTMKKLMELSNSVCHVRINGRAEGSGFLLFDKFVLTNGHVIKNIYIEETRQLTETVTVHFSYESLDQMEAGAEVEEVAGFEYYSNETEHKYDWALLKLGGEQDLPDGLLKNFGFLPPSGGICIIGHPDGGVKKIEPCLIVPFENRSQVAERHYHENPHGAEVNTSHDGENPGHIQLVTPRFFEDVAEWVNQNKQILTYESSFYFGSSGSPVFDEHCNVVAMHSGGYVYCNERGQSQSVIEYGYPLSVIIEQAIYQLVERGRFDVLKKYLAFSYTRHQIMMSNLKKLVEGRNLTAFRKAAKNPVVINDTSLNTFFEFLCQPEEPVQMDFE